jgi:hypothetical protein
VRCLITCFVLCCSVLAATAADTTVVVKKVRPMRTWASFGGVFGVHSTDFFQSYKRYLGGPSSTFDVPYVIEGGIASYLWKNVSVGLTASYYKAVVRESYKQFYPFGDTSATTLLSIAQDMSVTATPIIATIDYYPTDRQFATYVGAGLGIGISTIVWKQGVYGNGSASETTPYNDTHIVPAGLLRAGISLGWDKERTTKVAGALTFEVRYTFLTVTAPLFESLAGSLPNAGAETSGDYHIQAGGLGLHVGVSVIVN